jgi:hypothetical protein
MTLDPEADAADQAIRDALEELRGLLVDLGAKPYVESVDYLKWAFSEDRQAFFSSVNSGAVWRNMGSISDLGDRRVWQALVRLADALDAAHLASHETMFIDADMLRGWLAKDP